MNEATIALGVIVIALGAVILQRLAALERRLDALSRQEGKLDALLTHAGVQFDPYKDVPGTVVAALQRGEKIQAIKDYRVATGAGLKDAKDFVEELQRRRLS